MRYAIQNEIPVCANQLGHIYVLVVYPYIVALPGEPFDDFDHGAFSQIVGSGLEAKTEDPHAFRPLIHDQLQSPGDLQLVTWQNRVQDWQLQIVQLCRISQCPKVLWQTGASESKTGHQVRP